ncbi:methylenetetrahydrofolate dehydrogenase (NADP+) / methenyltetrahydrofolate cyclohydrolase [Marchantia polymorpha subsp. ruderalis]
MMGACVRGVMMNQSTLGLAPRPDCVTKAMNASWRSAVPGNSPTCCSRVVSAHSYRGFGSTAEKVKRSECTVLGNTIYGLHVVDHWASRHDLQPCRAILQDDVTASEATAEVIDGKKIAQDVRREIAQEVLKMKETVGKVPGLAVVLVGNRTDSATYVRSKKKACEEVGIASFGVTLPEDASEQEVLDAVSKFNDDPSVHGILVQLPLPKHMSEEKVVGAISVEKDVDGFHPLNVGRLALQGRTPLFVSCTPKGCIELLLRSGVEIAGKHAVVIGRSNVVGMPAAILLQGHNATVTTVHSRTPNPAEVTRSADIVIAAVGVAQLVRGDWIKPGAVVIDVGINSVDDPSAKKGYRLVGDVCYAEVAKVASKITPVPGGVGPMTIAMLLQNTLESAKRTFDL